MDGEIVNVVQWNFNPRSLAGATSKRLCKGGDNVFQSTLPRGSDACNPVAVKSI